MNKLVLVTLILFFGVNVYLIRSSQLVASPTVPKTEEYLNSLTDELESSHRDDVYSELQVKLESENAERLVEELKQKLKVENSDELVKEIEHELYVQNKDNIVKELEKEWYPERKDQILESLREEYYRSNEETLDKTILDELSNKKKLFFENTFKNILVKYSPKSEKLTKTERGTDCGCHWYHDVQNPPWNIEFLTKDRVNLPEDKFNDLQSNHDAVVRELNKLSFPSDLFHGKGIVINGGGLYFGSALIIARQVRELGSKLPIELIMDDESEYDAHICNDVMPKMNARCVLISETIGKGLHEFLNLKKFELKTMGLFVSSFEEIILLDADNFPVKNVDTLFDSDVYKKTQFLMWPDIWQRAISPLFYKIARIPVGEPVRRDQIANNKPMMNRNEMALHDLEGVPPTRTVETGQMVFSKKAHWKSFLLSVYYNMYGYSHYYRILFQGTCGEGDKETFIAALHVFNEAYYLNDYPSWLAGYHDDNFRESTIVQHDIVEAQAYLQGFKNWLISNGHDSRINYSQRDPTTRDLIAKFESDTETRKPSVQFLHLHKPKPNPLKNYQDNIYDRRYLGKPNSEYSQFWEQDWELKVYSISQWIACNVLDEAFYKKMKLDGKDVCKKVGEFVEFLKKDSSDASFAELKKFEI